MDILYRHFHILFINTARGQPRCVLYETSNISMEIIVWVYKGFTIHCMHVMVSQVARVQSLLARATGMFGSLNHS